ncbi:MAG: hypothetical protein EPN74_13255 [Rhodanobacter sp.]|nr:MAG: hypothetical protein EPN74_13255 [Rhodanobacter sp.]
MKVHCYLVLVATLGLSTGVTASAVAPSVTGTVTQVTPSGTDRQVVINGHTYVITRQTPSSGTTEALQPGQKVTFFLSSDGRKVIMIQAPDVHKTQP